MVIDPEPFAIDIPLPAVNVDREYPVPFPIRSVPLAARDPSIPVPPFAVGKIPVISVAPPARLTAELVHLP